MKIGGAWLLAFGVILMIGALIYQPTVDSGLLGVGSTYNLGLLQYQLMFFQAGIGFMISGTVLSAVGTLVETLETSGRLSWGSGSTSVEHPTGGPAAEEAGSVCGWCDRKIHKPYKPCSDCTDEQCRSAVTEISDPDCKRQLHEHGYT